MTLSVEVGREPRTRTCEDCGRSTHDTVGFVYRDGDAYALYFATLLPNPHPYAASLAIGLGEWSGEASDVSVFLAAWATRDEIRYGFIDPDESPWSGSPLLGGKLSADAAREHARRAEFLAVAEAVSGRDRSISDHIDAYTREDA